MASNLGELAIAGFQTGLNIRRNLEETAKLVRERELKEQAQQQIQAAMQKNRAIAEDIQYKQWDYQDKIGRKQDGQAVSDADIKTAHREYFKAALDSVGHLSQVAQDLMATGNEYSIQAGIQMQTSAVQTMQGLGGLYNQAQDMDKDERIAAMQAQTQRDIASQREAGETTRTQMQTDTSRANVGTEQAGALTRAQLEAKTHVQTTGMEVNSQDYRAGLDVGERQRASKAALSEEARQFDALRAEHKADTNTPDKVFERVLLMHKGLSALRGAGMDDAQIDKEIGGSFHAKDFEDKFASFSDDAKAKLLEQNQYLKSLEARQERGESVSDRIKATKERIKKLQEKDDKLRDIQFESEDFSNDLPLARRIGRGFITVLGGVDKVLETPEEALAGAGEQLYENISGTPPRTSKADWGDLIHFLGLGQDSEPKGQPAKKSAR